MDRFSQKRRRGSKFSSRSRSRSLSYDLSLKSKKRNLFNQSFDSKLSEFSDNSETMVLSRPKKIREYEQYGDKKQKMNSLTRQLEKKRKSKGLKLGNEFEEREPLQQETQKKIKNFTFSENNGGKSSRQGGKKLFLDMDLDGNFNPDSQIQKSKKKVDLKLHSPKNFSDSSGGKDQSEKSPKSEVEFELSLPISMKKSKKAKFELALDIVNSEADEKKMCPKPPSLGKSKKFNMAGSSWGNLGFSLGTGQQKVLNAPRNNKKVSFNFGSDIVNRNLRQNFKLGARNQFASKLQIVIPEENSRDVDCDSDEPELELPSLKDRRGRKAKQNQKKFDLAIDTSENKGQKVIMIDEFQDSVSDKEKSKRNLDLNYQNDRTSSNSPRHVSGISESQNSNSECAKQWKQKACTKNLEIRFDSNLMNLTMGNKNENDIFSGCRTNPLPTCKNANQKYKGFGFGGPSRKKRHLTVSLTGEEMFEPRKEKKTQCIDEVSNEELQSNSGSPGKLQKKRSLKMKINSKNSEFTKKNFSKQSSQMINSIQSKTQAKIMSSALSRQQLHHFAKMWKF